MGTAGLLDRLVSYKHGITIEQIYSAVYRNATIYEAGLGQTTPFHITGHTLVVEQNFQLYSVNCRMYQ